MKIRKEGSPVIFHPQVSRISADLNEFFDRLNYYGATIASKTNNSNFRIILLIAIQESEYTGLIRTNYPHLVLLRVMNPTWNFVSFARKSQRILSSHGINPSLLIAGDLMLGLWAVMLFNRRLISRCPVQVSVHGSLTSKPKGLIPTLKYWIRLYSLKKILPHVESVRVVSKFLRLQLMKEFGLNEEKFFVAPITFSNYPDFCSRDFTQINLGIIGRLHPERNFLESLKILQAVIDNEKISNIFIVGDGPQRNLLLGLSSKVRHVEKIQTTGGITHRSVQELLPSIDILISAAVSEGYGLAIREAIISGATVLARNNEGTQEVLKQFSKGIFLYDHPDQAISIILAIANGRLEPSICVSGITIQQQIDNESLAKLASSWS